MVQTQSAHSLPIEDISALLLEIRQSTITTAALSRLGQCGCANYAIERCVQSLGRALEDKEKKLLPRLTELKQHSYE